MQKFTGTQINYLCKFGVHKFESKYATNIDILTLTELRTQYQQAKKEARRYRNNEYYKNKQRVQKHLDHAKRAWEEAQMKRWQITEELLMNACPCGSLTYEVFCYGCRTHYQQLK